MRVLAAAVLGLLGLAALARAEESATPSVLIGKMQTLGKSRPMLFTEPTPPPLFKAAAPVPPNKLPGPMGGEIVDGIRVRGTPAFILKTKSSLELLKKSSKYDRIRADLGAIEEGRCSGMWVYGDTPTYFAGRPTWDGDLLWYAGTIAHDSMHAELYAAEKKRLGGAEPAASVWSGAQVEKVCMMYQLGVLEELGASQKVRDYLAKLIGPTPRKSDGPDYQNIGAGKANVCDGRNW